MVVESKLVIVLLNTPVPVPSDVLVESAMVGPVDVLQHTPRAVTARPPSETTLPPDKAELEVIELAAVVNSMGVVFPTGGADVTKLTSFP